jgi:tRNA-Thr(GGU) m(6)t(6)A37 methyltransferase TsaA
MDVSLEAIGFVSGGRAEPVDDHWGDVEATIVLDDTRFELDATRCLDEFSHLEVVYLFHLVEPGVVTLGARRPRGNPEWPLVGILAQRAKARPNRLGVSRCEIVDVDGLKVRVRGLDAVDGTPVLDIKPYMREFGPRGDVRQPRWAEEIMRRYFESGERA